MHLQNENSKQEISVENILSKLIALIELKWIFGASFKPYGTKYAVLIMHMIEGESFA